MADPDIGLDLSPPSGMASAEISDHRHVLGLLGVGMVARFSGTLLAAIASFATTAIVVRLLGTSRYGTLALGLAIVGLVGVAGRLGLGLATVRKVAAMRASGDRFGIEETARAVTTLMTSLAILGAALVAGLIYFTQRGNGSAAAWSLAIGLGLLLLGRNAAVAGQAIAQGMGRMVLMEIPGLALILFQFLVVLVFKILGVPDVNALALGFGAAGLLSVVISHGLIRRILSGPERPFRPALGSALGLIVLAAPYAVAAITTQIIARFDVLILGLSHTSAVVGTYESTLRVVDSSLLLAPAILIAPFVPAATILFTQENRSGFRDLYILVSKLAYFGSLPIVLALVAFPEVTLRAFFGPHYSASRGVVWILLAGYIVNLTFGLNSQALIAAGQRRLLAKIYLIALISMIGLSVSVIPIFGATGAALSTACSYVVLNVGIGWALFRSTGANPFRSDMIALLLTSLLPVVGVLLARQVVIHPSVPLIALVSIGLWALWFGVVLWTRALRMTELLLLVPRRAKKARGRMT